MKTKAVATIAIIFIFLIACLGLFLFLKEDSSNNKEISQSEEYAEFIGEDDIIKDTSPGDERVFDEEQRVVYSVYGDESLDPKILEVEIYPWSVSPGESQTITVLTEFAATKGIAEGDKVSATLITDSKSREIQLSLADTNMKKDSGASWMGVWACDDEYSGHYELFIKASSLNGESSVVLTLR